MKVPFSGRSSGFRDVAVGATLAACLAACNDLAPVERREKPVAPNEVDAQLVISDPAPRPGDGVVALVQVNGGTQLRGVASFTARVRYDTTRLRLEGESPLNDDAMRVINPAPGETRIAGIAMGNGFPNGQLVALRFTALRADVVVGLQLAFDELHSVDRADLQKGIHMKPPAERRSFK